MCFFPPEDGVNFAVQFHILILLFIKIISEIQNTFPLMLYIQLFLQYFKYGINTRYILVSGDMLVSF